MSRLLFWSNICSAEYAYISTQNEFLTWKYNKEKLIRTFEYTRDPILVNHANATIINVTHVSTFKGFEMKSFKDVLRCTCLEVIFTSV